MSTHPSDTGLSRYSVVALRERLFSLLKTLDKVEPEQFAQYDGLCHLCNTQYYGILDESRVEIPIFQVSKYFSPKGKWKSVQTNRGLQVDYDLSPYEIRQKIVRSGLFKREDLRDFPFSQHELEVNDRSFNDIRPKRCDCDFGEAEMTSEEIRLLEEFSELVETDGFKPVEEKFISGDPVRTGFRLRSKEAIRRRRLGKRSRDRLVADFMSSYVREVYPVQHPISLGTQLGTVTPEPIKLSFKTDECLRKPSKIFESAKIRHKGRFCNLRNNSSKNYLTVPLKGILKKKKYFYFLRKRGTVRISIHHPNG